MFDLPYDTVGYGDVSSPHDVIEVVIERKTKLQQAAGVHLESFSPPEQVKFFGAVGGRLAVLPLIYRTRYKKTLDENYQVFSKSDPDQVKISVVELICQL